ncbi:radical SAM family heme chaperone HemW [Parabacteroides sp. PF5-9]|uniref:radical SAM family heme chaperone HemW n=1 Tax=Parabacteroides sp. PF5-9 TaxID=1742404 RepID=UPI002476A6A2|nr:radical SAM family heme chaperone HemW [Parabacteroides sp. PF5-9]MDH6358455.1 putative oxygen-independent coproporphyrinogen III oxidase [Parabacteroides sp. PF5-9]
MAGIYIHVPFCTKRCLYCDFFSNTDMQYKTMYMEALLREMELRKHYLEGEAIETIYLGGGTPSQLAVSDFERIFEQINLLFDLSRCREITLEANPDDLSIDYLASLAVLPFNRISIGVQSFDPEDLKFLNRRHTAEQAVAAVDRCRQAGFTNLSLDLIYGLPGSTLTKWEENLDQFLALDIPHLSAYHLIYEEGTPLYRLLESGEINPLDEEDSVAFFSSLMEKLSAAGYAHYEISNFARPGYISQHNSSYWMGKKYVGLGPSAHSYNGISRQWNISSMPSYIAGVQKGILAVETENLDLYTRYNDYVITRLRTMWGISYDEILQLFGEELMTYCQKQMTPFLQQGTVIEKENGVRLTKKGIFISDHIMSDLLFVE